MVKFEALFEDGTTIVKTTADGFRNRLDFFNWISAHKFQLKHGPLVEITARPTIK